MSGGGAFGGRSRGGNARRPPRRARRTRPLSDGAGRVERDRDAGVVHGRCRDDVGPVPVRSGGGNPGWRDRVVYRGHIRQPVGAVHPAPDPVQQQPETRFHVAVSGHQRLHRAHRHAGPDVRGPVLAGHHAERVVVPVPRAVAVFRPGLRVRGHRDGRRTLAGPHQTVFLPKGT